MIYLCNEIIIMYDIIICLELKIQKFALTNLLIIFTLLILHI